MGDLAEYYGGDGFDTNREDAATGEEFDPLPTGWYSVEIEKEEIRKAKLKNRNGPQGIYLWLQLSVIGERYNGRKLFSRITVQNASEKAEEIGKRDLAGLGQAVGIPLIRLTEALLGKQLDVRVVVKENKQYGNENDVKAYAPLGSKTESQPAAAPSGHPRGDGVPSTPAVPAAAPAASTKRPWER